ncbi:hypothetical protein ASD56_02670 [Microbacterium sp. Root166]|uniref:ArsR/SmtB family transcription factor n=1 Tax=Microbacterium sp. Root166 TaxID=1736478 RepID=UPI0006FF926B|nr:helix-turn-helix domain-containing protein [Microbacterium sp. Root166]KQZ85282.1 hypothetical protein ASD56_02670 [Microbacterium sp. Root166]
MTYGQDISEEERGLRRVFAALANADRIAIVDLLRGCVEDEPAGVSISRVAESIGLTRFSASRHLRVLCEAGLVSATRRQHSVLHRLDAGGFDAMEDWLCGPALSDHWLDAFAPLHRPA